MADATITRNEARLLDDALIQFGRIEAPILQPLFPAMPWEEAAITPIDWNDNANQQGNDELWDQLELDFSSQRGFAVEVFAALANTLLRSVLPSSPPLAVYLREEIGNYQTPPRKLPYSIGEVDSWLDGSSIPDEHTWEGIKKLLKEKGEETYALENIYLNATNQLFKEWKATCKEITKQYGHKNLTSFAAELSEIFEGTDQHQWIRCLSSLPNAFATDVEYFLSYLRSYPETDSDTIKKVERLVELRNEPSTVNRYNNLPFECELSRTADHRRTTSGVSLEELHTLYEKYAGKTIGYSTLSQKFTGTIRLSLFEVETLDQCFAHIGAAEQKPSLVSIYFQQANDLAYDRWQNKQHFGEALACVRQYCEYSSEYLGELLGDSTAEHWEAYAPGAKKDRGLYRCPHTEDIENIIVLVDRHQNEQIQKYGDQFSPWFSSDIAQQFRDEHAKALAILESEEQRHYRRPLARAKMKQPKIQTAPNTPDSMIDTIEADSEKASFSQEATANNQLSF